MQEMGHGSTDGNLMAQDQGYVLGVIAVRFLPIPEFLSWFVRANAGYLYRKIS